jgi:hypothetical protein
VTNVDIEGAISDYAATGAVKRAEIYGTPTRWTDATGCVWRVEDGMGVWLATTNVISDVVVEEGITQVVFKYGTYTAWGYLDPGVDYSSLSTFTISAGWYYWLDDDFTERGTGEFPVTFVREIVPNATTNLIGRLALTNDVADARREAKEYTDALETQLAIGNKTVMSAQYANSAYDSMRLYDDGASVSYTASDIIRVSTDAARQMTNGLPEAIGRKQDELPYPTNAIPYAAISGAPSGGGQAWRVEAQACGAFGFVTNGMSIVTFADYDPLQLANGALPENSGWPDGAAMFSRWLIASEGVSGYWPASYMRLVGYGTWPTNDCQCVLWRSGTNIYVNVIMEER